VKVALDILDYINCAKYIGMVLSASNLVTLHLYLVAVSSFVIHIH